MSAAVSPSTGTSAEARSAPQSPLPGSTGGGTPRRRGLAATFGRHQVGSVIATAVDFATMTVLVSGLGLAPALATAIGAAVGGVTNFGLGRHWIFAAREDRVGAQATRYALVSGASLGFNAGGEYILHHIAGIQYVLARVVIAALVSVCWNFPVQRAFVYGRRTPGRDGTGDGHGIQTS